MEKKNGRLARVLISMIVGIIEFNPVWMAGNCIPCSIK